MCLIGMTSRAKPAKSSDLQKKKLIMINFVNRLVIIIIIKADADGARDFILTKMTVFMKTANLVGYISC